MTTPSACEGIPLLDKIRTACRRLGLRGERLLLAVSGGADSVAMLLAMAELTGEFELRLAVGTIDHQLREGSAEDARFVEALARTLGIPCVGRRVTLAPGNLEAEARKARYRALHEMAEGALVATAHTLDDQAETLLMRLGRGTGLAGLRGVHERSDGLVRPLLAVRRTEVLEYLELRRVVPRTDPTNASDRFLRNRVRHHLLPQFETLFEGGVEALGRLARIAAEDERYIGDQARAALAGLGSPIPLVKLRALPATLRRRALRLLYDQAALAAIERLEAALDTPHPVTIEMGNGRVARLRYGHLEIPPPVIGGGWREAPGEGRREGIHPPTLRLDPTHLHPPLVWRTRRPGDRFRPLGGHEKSLKAFLIDKKVPRELRDSLALLVDARGSVLWIVGENHSWRSHATREGERATNPWEVTFAGLPGGSPDGALQTLGMLVSSADWPAPQR